MTWFIWIIVGFVLVLAELATPGGFFFIFFGVGAILVGLIELAWIDAPGWVQWLLFSVLSLVSLAVFRKPLLRRLEPTHAAPPVDSMVGATATALEALAPGASGRAELRGTTWSAKNAGDRAIASGQPCEVVRVEELTLFLVGR